MNVLIGLHFCAITLYHLDAVEEYLTEFEHVTNQFACILRCFLDINFLKVLYCACALIEPFLPLTTSASTTHSKLMPAF